MAKAPNEIDAWIARRLVIALPYPTLLATPQIKQDQKVLESLQ